MKNIHLLILIILTLFSCNNGNYLKEKELGLKERELQIREKELLLKETNAKSLKSEVKQIKITKTEIKKKRKLRYLWYGNIGLKGYFNDGTIAGCGRCDLSKSNIKSLYAEESGGNYSVNNDGSLLVEGEVLEYPRKAIGYETDGWALIDYKWVKDLSE